MKIFQELAFKKVVSFGANNRVHFVPFLKPNLPNNTVFHTTCRHPCSFYNSAAVPTDAAYDDLDSMCKFIAPSHAPSQSYGAKLRSEQGHDLAVRQALQSAANSAAGKIGGKSQNNAAHKDGVWYNAFCDNPNCVEKRVKWKTGKDRGREAYISASVPLKWKGSRLWALQNSLIYFHQFHLE